MAQCERNATLAADQLADRLETEKLSANQLVPVFGVSVDKLLALTGKVPCVQIDNVIIPSAEERARKRRDDAIVDALTKQLLAAASQDAP